MKKKVCYLKLGITMALLLFMSVGVSKASIVDATLFLNPTSDSTTVGGSNVTYTARVNPGSNIVNGVNGVQLDVTFDPAVVHLVSATAVSPFIPMLPVNVATANISGSFSFSIFVAASGLTTTSDVATLVFSPQGVGTNSPIAIAGTSEATEHTTGDSLVSTRTGATVTVGASSDVTAPTITVVNGTSMTPITSDVINITVTDASGVAGRFYGFSADNVCDGSDTIDITFTSGSNFTLSGDETRYLCAKATDNVGNISYQLIGQLHLDSTAPLLALHTAVITPTNNVTPDFAFDSTEAGIISYGGGCSSINTVAIGGTNIISFNALATGTHTCTVTVTDAAGNASSALTTGAFVVNAPPILSAGLPTGTLPAGTTQTTVSFTTDENAICSWAATSGVAFGSMTNIIDTVAGTAHSFAATALANGVSYGYFVRCQDASNNPNISDYLISFIVANPAVVSSSSHHSSKSTPSRTITNSKKSLKVGQILTQRGKKFSKNTIVNLYFSRYGGAYYPPVKIKTSSTGSFMLTYKVNKQKGTYSWYAVDTKNNKSSKKIYYKVK